MNILNDIMESMSVSSEIGYMGVYAGYPLFPIKAVTF